MFYSLMKTRILAVLLYKSKLTHNVDVYRVFISLSLRFLIFQIYFSSMSRVVGVELLKDIQT